MAKRRRTKSSRTAPRRRPKAKRRHRLPLWKRTNQQRTPQQRHEREKSLEALSLVRREKLSLREASKRVGLGPQTVKDNTGAFRRVRGRWKAKSFDRIPRAMITYERGRKIIVQVGDSRTASLIGEYHNRVKQFLETGRSSILTEFPRKRLKDTRGRVHVLETNPKNVLKIKAREAKPEFFEIYRR